MSAAPGHKRSQQLIEGEAHRRIMEAPATLAALAQQPLDWFRASFSEASPMTLTAVENQIRETWNRRHEMIRGGDP